MNLVILGCGRSGTSLLSSLFAHAGFYSGSRLHPARDTNPAGFYESGEINEINNRILADHTSCNGLSGWVGIYDEPVTKLPAEVLPRIEAEVAQSPWCFKDPRFSYTLPAWESWLGACTVLCAFREPTAVIHSLLQECTAHYPQYGLTAEGAEHIWRSQYLQVFERIEPRHRLHYVAYEDLLHGVAITALETRLGVTLDRGLVRPGLNRHGGRGWVVSETEPETEPETETETETEPAPRRVSAATQEVYERLMESRL